MEDLVRYDLGSWTVLAPPQLKGESTDPDRVCIHDVVFMSTQNHLRIRYAEDPPYTIRESTVPASFRINGLKVQFCQSDLASKQVWVSSEW